MANTITGKVLIVGQTVNVSKKGGEFLKRELVLDTSRYDELSGEKRENYVTINFTQKRCAVLDGLKQGEFVEVSFILSGRKYESEKQTKYITDIVGYKVERKNLRQNDAESVTQIEAPRPVEAQTDGKPDLPF